MRESEREERREKREARREKRERERIKQLLCANIKRGWVGYCSHCLLRAVSQGGGGLGERREAKRGAEEEGGADVY